MIAAPRMSFSAFTPNHLGSKRSLAHIEGEHNNHMAAVCSHSLSYFLPTDLADGCTMLLRLGWWSDLVHHAYTDSRVFFMVSQKCC